MIASSGIVGADRRVRIRVQHRVPKSGIRDVSADKEDTAGRGLTIGHPIVLSSFFSSAKVAEAIDTPRLAFRETP